MAAPALPGARNLRLLLEYDGSDFVGWQRQAGLPTVQGALETALVAVLRAPLPRLSCAGRTDAGVHALCQVVNFHLVHPMPARRLAPALNFYLPKSIRVHRSEEVAASFDARLSAGSKLYTYQIYSGPHPPALDRQRLWHLRARLDLPAMQAAARDLIGEHDFESFRHAHCDAQHARRHMHGVQVRVEPRRPVGELVTCQFHANAFCRHMCRILAGTLVEVGRGQRLAASMPALLAARDRRQAGVTAPARGLVLTEVYYKGEHGAPPVLA